jgi:hypothetical protein
LPYKNEGLHFSGGVSSFPPVLAGNERNALLWVADELSLELGYAGGSAEVPGANSKLGGEGGPLAGILNAEDDLLVARMRRGLANVVAAVGAGREACAPEGAVGAALDGAEMVIRGVLVSGNGAQLPELMPSFVFMVVLPVVDQDQALNLSKRTAQLMERALS